MVLCKGFLEILIFPVRDGPREESLPVLGLNKWEELADVRETTGTYHRIRVRIRVRLLALHISLQSIEHLRRVDTAIFFQCVFGVCVV